MPALDGLRAGAVLAVLAYHLDAPWARGGYLGVDIFFVLSGYLITGLLVDEVEQSGRVDLVAFWSRRLRRLLPALVVTIAVLLAWALWWADPVARARFRGDGLASLLYVANWRFINTDASYFDSFASGNPLTHLWSLAIEEQFYLVWPIVLIGLTRVARTPERVRRFLAIGCGVGVIVSAALMAGLYSGGDASRVYYGTDTHAFGLLIGALGSVLPHPLRFRRPAALASLASLLALVGAIVFLRDDSAFAYRGGIALAALCALPLVMGASVPGLVRQVFSWKPLVQIGRVSYGLYLWHWPVIIVLDESETGWNGPALLILRLAVIAGLTTLSFLLIEQPIRQRRVARSVITAGPAALTCGALLAVGLFSVDASPTVYASPIDISSLTSTTVGAAEGSDVLAATVEAPPARPAVFVVGDSTGAALLLGLPDAGEDIGVDVIPGAVVPGAADTFCPLDLSTGELRLADGSTTSGVIDPLCDWSQMWPTVLDHLDVQVSLMVFGMWDSFSRRVDGQWLEAGSASWRDHMVSQTICAISVLSSEGARVGILLVPPSPNLPEANAAALNEVYAEAVAALPDRSFLVDVGDEVTAHPDWRWDGTHYTPEGADELAPTVLNEVRNAVRQGPIETREPPPWCPNRAGLVAP